MGFIHFNELAAEWRQGFGRNKKYARLFNFPFLALGRAPAVYAIAAAVTVVAAVPRAVQAASRAAWLPPTVALQPPGSRHSSTSNS